MPDQEGHNALLSLIAAYLESRDYAKAATAVRKQAKKEGVDLDHRNLPSTTSFALNDGTELDHIWDEWVESKAAVAQAAKISDDDDEDDESSASESNEEDSESESDSDGDEEETNEAPAGVIDYEADSTSDDGSSSSGSEGDRPTLKRKRVSSSSSSSASDSSASEQGGAVDHEMVSEPSSLDDSSSSDEDDARPAKRAKLSSSDSSSDSGSSSSISSDSDSDSENSDSASHSDQSAESASESASSDSDSSSDDSDSESVSASSLSGSPPPNNKTKKDEQGMVDPTPTPRHGAEKKKKAVNHIKTQLREAENNSSASSATLGAESPKKLLDIDTLVIPAPQEEDNSDIHPSRRRGALAGGASPATTTMEATEENIARLKKENIPFSRIPKDTKVDPKFASNAYVPYDYGKHTTRVTTTSAY